MSKKLPDTVNKRVFMSLFFCCLFLCYLSEQAIAQAGVIASNLPRRIAVPLPPETHVLFVDASLSSSGTGTQSHPFNSIVDAHSYAANNPSRRPLYIKAKGNEVLNNSLYFTASGAGAGQEIVVTSTSPTDSYSLHMASGHAFRLIGSHVTIDGRSMVSPKIIFIGNISESWYRVIRLGDQGGSYQTLWRVEVQNGGYMGVSTDGGQHLNIINCTIHHNRIGLYTNSGDHVRVAGNYIFDNQEYGIHHNCHYDAPQVGHANHWTYAENLLINNNRNVFDASGSPAVSDCGHISNVVVKNNMISTHNIGWYLGGVSGIPSCTSLDNIKFINNTFYNNTIALETRYKHSAEGVVKNNLFIDNTTNINQANGSNWETVSTNINTTASYVLSVDPLNSNFMKFQGTSHLKDGGENVSADGINVDYFGTTRPQGISYDCGAFEFFDVTPHTPAPPQNLRLQIEQLP